MSALAVLALWLVVSGMGAPAALRSVRAEGAHHTARVWVASPVVRWLDNQAPADLPVYADAPFLVHVQTGQPALDLAGALDRPDAFAEAFRRRPGVVVLTGPTAGDREPFPDVGLVVVVDAAEGRVLVPAPLPDVER